MHLIFSHLHYLTGFIKFLSTFKLVNTISIKVINNRVNYISVSMVKNCYEPSESWNVDKCKTEKMYHSMMADLGCTVPWLENKTNICKNRESAKKAYEIYINILRDANDDCMKTCDYLRFTNGQVIETDRHDDFGQLILTFGHSVMNIEEYFLSSPIDLLANIGGYVGLFLGVSMLNLKDVITKGLNYFETK